MAFNMSYAFQAVDEFSAVSTKINSSLQKTIEKVQKASDGFKRFGESAQRIGMQLSLRLSTPIIALGYEALKTGSDLDELSSRFLSVSGSMSKATEFAKQLEDFGVKSPFDNEEIASSAFQFRSLGFSTKDTMTNLKALSDVAVGLGGNISTTVGMLMRVKEMPTAVTFLLRDFPQITAEIAKMRDETGKTHMSIKKLATAGAVTYDVLMEAFKRMAGKGGVFFDQTKMKMQSFMGLLTVARKSIMTYLLEPFGTVLTEQLGINSAMSKFNDYLEKNKDRISAFIQTHKELIGIIAKLGLMLAILPPILLLIGSIVLTVNLLMSPITLVVLAITAILGLIGYVIYKLAGVHGLLVTIKVLFDVIKGILSIIGWLINAMIVEPIATLIEDLKIAYHWFRKLVPSKASVNLTKTATDQKQFTKLIMPTTSGLVSDININLSDPYGVVSDVGAKTKGAGTTNLNVGKNMALSGAH